MDNKLRSIKAAVLSLDKEFGKGTVMRLGSGQKLNVSVMPTGILSIDLALGVGGLPRGRIVEIYGPEGSGKTTVALHAVAEAQKKGGYAAFIDVEHALDPNYAREIGINTDDLFVAQPTVGEEALTITERLVQSEGIDVVVIDSVAALIPRAEHEGAMGDAHVGLQARLMSQAMRKLSGAISSSHTVVIFINQIREKVGILFGSPEVTPGGRALKFYASIRLDIRKREPIKQGSEIIGTRTQVKVVKNKVAPPFKETQFDLIYGKGVSREGCILDIAVDQEIIEKNGSWYQYRDQRIGQGRENSKKFLQENSDTAKQIEESILEKMGLAR
ncbi:MAG: DNA recombination/repair protein RecA [Firmicutes bacterium ML8_F2]|nr:MAG: DNA recombination/repair protein RecA [Firmicutes bacterium ML8_F2]